MPIGLLEGKLAFRLIVRIVLLGIAVTAVVTGVQSYFVYQNDLAELDADFDAVEQGYLAAVTENVWVVDAERLKILAEGIAGHPSFDFAEVTGHNGVILARTGDKPRGEARTERHDLIYSFRGEERRIGTLTVSAGLRAIRAEAWEQATAILVTNGLQTFAVCLFIFFFVRGLITRHLEHLAGYARTLTVDRLAAPLALNRRPGSGKGDELGTLVEAFNAMREDLRASYDELARLNEDLEQRVDDRTAALNEEIEERKRTEAALADKEEQLRRIFDTAADAILTIDSVGDILAANKACERLFGHAAADLIGRNVRMLMPEPYHSEHDGYLAAYLRTRQAKIIGKRREALALRKDGSTFPVELSVSEVELGGDLLFTGIVSDISRRKEAEAAMVTARDEANRANKAKSEFLSNMSHELRTPLNAILGFSQLLEYAKKDPLSDKQKDHVQQIMKGGRHLLDLINEILDLAKIEAGRLSVSIETVECSALIGECLPMAETLAKRRDIRILDRSAGRALPQVAVDFTRGKQVLLNLLSNAVKYNREGGRVWVDAEAIAGGSVRFSVTDTGAGIPEDKRSELFKPFNRLGAEATEIEGTGIGLALTMKLVEHMDGTIGVESEVGKGSTFWVELPAVCDPGSRPETGDGESPPRLHLGTRERVLLYVEDNPANLTLMESVIEDIPNLTLASAHTAEIGIAMAERERPDAIVVDVNLPGMSGIEAVRLLKGNPDTRAIPVLALSADAMPGTVRRGLEAGFEAYLTKPVNIGDLVSALREALDGD